MKQLSMRDRRSGFNLVELSIVLVILGLLIGGVFAGQNLIQASKLRSVMTDANTYLSAVNQFRTQYRYLPGDLPGAAGYWAAVTPGSNVGDGIVDKDTEEYIAWQEMNLAGFVEKSFTGTPGGGATPGTNIPEARIPTAGFRFYYANFAGDATTYTVNMGNMLTFGTNGSGAILNPADAYMIDAKMDDGAPGTGKWLAAIYSGGCTNAANQTDYASTYTTSSTSVACAFMIQTGN